MGGVAGLKPLTDLLRRRPQRRSWHSGSGFLVVAVAPLNFWRGYEPGQAIAQATRLLRSGGPPKGGWRYADRGVVLGDTETRAMVYPKVHWA